METETKTAAGIRPTTNAPGKLSVWVDDEGAITTGQGRRVVAIVSAEELQALVQAAYDGYGMLAEPSMDVELARVAEANPGLCRCGQPGCSDGDAALREFADRWGQSLRGRA